MAAYHRTRIAAWHTAFLLIVLPLLLVVNFSQAATTIDADYLIQPGDSLVVSVLGDDGLGGTRVVGPAGTINLPVVGTVTVGGKTLTQARGAIVRGLSDVIREPYVTVALDEMASRRRVYVDGRVGKMGSQLVPLGTSIVDAVVGADPAEDADLRQVQLARADGRTVKLDLSGLRTGTALPRDVEIAWDDHIYIPVSDDRVTLLGQVQKPGSYMLPLGHKMRLLDLLTTVAGGFTEGAERSRLLLMRAGRQEPEKVDLVKLLKDGDLRQNYELQAGDIVLMPEASRIAMAGEVLSPFSMYAPDHFTVLEAITRAGGFTPLAGLRQAEINRSDGTTVSLDLDALWRRGDLSQNLVLASGDVITVPRATPEEVLMTGAVMKPGAYDLRDLHDCSLLRAMTTVGSAASADLTRVSVYRGSTHMVINVRNAMEKGDRKQNPQLLPGDVVYVPDSDRIMLLGGLGHPGHQLYDPKLTLMDYITLAGGVVNGHPDRAVLVRPLPDGTAETTKLDLSKLEQGILPEPVPVKPGDIIYVPPVRQKSSLVDALREMLWTLGSIKTLFN